MEGSRFRDRRHAGQVLASMLERHRGRPDVVVLGLPRGGVPVAAEVARALDAPLDVFVVRKLGVPGHEELAMGAIATGGVIVVNDEVVGHARISREVLAAQIAREAMELERREATYRADRPSLMLRDRTVIVVDDGLATGSTMRAAIAALGELRPAGIVVAVPTAPAVVCEELAESVDEVVSAMTPPYFEAVGQWYDDFTQTTDDEVCRLVAEGITRGRRRG